MNIALSEVPATTAPTREDAAMTTMTYDAEFDLDRFLVYLEKLRFNRPRGAVERRVQATRLEEPVVENPGAEATRAEPGH
jgi:hypothetical protein